MIYRQETNAAGEIIIEATHGDTVLIHETAPSPEGSGLVMSGHTWEPACLNTTSLDVVTGAITVTDNSTTDTLDLMIAIDTGELDANVKHEWRVTSPDDDLDYTLRSGTVLGRRVAGS